MSDTTQTNAMAEIALALAMGFFSIMVLTMVSMGSGMVSQKQSANLVEDPISIAKSKDKAEPQETKGSTRTVKAENLIIFHQGRFFDHNLHPVSADQIAQRDKVVLAVNPNLSMSATLQAREQIKSRDITVVVLNETWLTALKEAQL